VGVGLSRGTFSEGVEDGFVSSGNLSTVQMMLISSPYPLISTFVKTSPISYTLPLNVRDVFKVAIEDLGGQSSFESERHFLSKKKVE
jgi:hypothetical protein